jgi:hypothetical protein
MRGFLARGHIPETFKDKLDRKEQLVVQVRLAQQVAQQLLHLEIL